MTKQTILLCAPVTSRSGYGNHARDIATSLLNNDKYDLFIQDVPWGACPRNALMDNNNPIVRELKASFLNHKNLMAQPDIYIDLRIPNEFQQHGKINIGMTAGIETNAVSPKWIECCNNMDLVITTSEHSKKGFTQSTYDQLQKMPDGSQQKIGTLKLEKPIETLFEGADMNIYKKTDSISENINELFETVDNDFCYLFVGQWTKGGYGEDRKDIAKTIKVFIEAFANKENQPCLVLKTNGATSSIIDREEILSKIKAVKNMFPSDWKLPKIYLIHGDFTDIEMNELYNHPKVKCMVSFTHGEGFGRPLLEATVTGLPVIASGWSGQLDFLDSSKSLLIQGEIKQIPPSQYWQDIVIPESSWFNIKENHAYNCLIEVFTNYDLYKSKAEELMEINRDKFNFSKMSESLYKMIDEIAPKKVSLKLPKLKLNKNKSEKIKLPDLSETLGGV